MRLQDMFAGKLPIVDILHDIHVQDEVEKLLNRALNLDNSRWYISRREDNLDIPALSRYDLIHHRSPRVDFEIVRAVFTFLRAKLFPSENSTYLNPLVTISLHDVLKEKLRENQRKQVVPLQQQMELALLWRTMTLFLESDDISFAIEFFHEFLITVKALPPLSLSIYWTERPQRDCMVGIKGNDGDNDSIEKQDETDTPILPVPELNYLTDNDKSDGISDPSAAAAAEEEAYNRKEHDPLGVVQKLFNTAEYLAGVIGPSQVSDQATLLSMVLALGVKSGRASLLLSAAKCIASTDAMLTNDELDIAILKDIEKYVRENCADLKDGFVDHSCNSDFGDTYETLRDVIQRSCGGNNGGVILSFGKADHGKLGHGDSQVHRAVPTLVESMRDINIVKVASMSTYSVVVDAEGAVYVWGTGGSSGNMQGLRTDIVPQPLDALSEKAPVRDVACGLGHALFLMANGRVCAWGNGGNGRLGLGDTADRAEACVIADLMGEVVDSVYCGASHSMAVIKRSGRVYTWGKNTQGQCGRGNMEDILKPTLNTALKSEVIVKMAAGWEHSIALSASGRVYAWGSGYKDSRRGLVPPVLGLGHSEGRTLPELLTSIESIHIIDIASGWDHCLAVDSKRRVFSWGSGQNGKLGHGSEENVTAPCIIPALENQRALAIAAGCEHSAVITEDGMLYTWGHGDGGRLGHGDNDARSIPSPVMTLAHMHARPVLVSCGDKFTIVAVEPYAATNDVFNPGHNVASTLDDRARGNRVLSLDWLHKCVDEHLLRPKRRNSHQLSATLQAMPSQPAPDSPDVLRSKSLTFDRSVVNKMEADMASENVGTTDNPDYISGRSVLLSLLSLMSRSFDKRRYESIAKCQTSDTNEKPPKTAVEYSVELSAQTFNAINNTLCIIAESFFKSICKDESNVDFTSDQQHDIGRPDGCSTKTDFLGLGVNTDWLDVLQDKKRSNSNSSEVDTALDETSHALPDRMVNWGIIRFTLSVLQHNLYVLNVTAASASRRETQAQRRKSLKSSIESAYDFLEKEIVERQLYPHSLNSTERLAAILGGSIEEHEVRSSDDDDDDDDAKDDDDDEDSEDDDEDDDDYEQSGDHLDESDLCAEEEDQYDDYDISKATYDDDEDSREDEGLNLDDYNGNSSARRFGDGVLSARGRMSVGDSTPGTSRAASGAYLAEGNNDIDTQNENSLSHESGDDADFKDDMYRGLDISSAASEEDVDDLIRVEGGGNVTADYSPAPSNESLQHRHMASDCKEVAENKDLVCFEKGANAEAAESVGFAREYDGIQGQVMGIQFGTGENEEEDEDMQKAIFSSIDSRTGEGENIFELMLQYKDFGQSSEVLQRLSGQLEYMSRRIFDIIVSAEEKLSEDIVAMIFLWKDIQNCIGLGFSSMYSTDEQKEVVLSVIARSEEWLHIFPAVFYGLKNEEIFGVLAKDLIVLCKDTHIRANQIDLDDITSLLRKMKVHNLTITDIMNEVIYSSTGDDATSNPPPFDGERFCENSSFCYILFKSILEVVKLCVSFLFLQKTTNPVITIGKVENCISDFLSVIVEMVDVEINSIVSYLPSLLGNRYQKHAGTRMFHQLKDLLNHILQNSITGSLLSTIGGLFSSGHNNVECVTIFLPHALDLLKIFEKYSDILTTESNHYSFSDMGNYLKEWLLNEMRWVFLFVSSAVGIASRARSDLALSEEKFSLSKCYDSCPDTLIDGEEFIKTPSHPVWIRLGPKVKVWSYIGDSDKYFSSGSINASSKVVSDEWSSMVYILASTCGDNSSSDTSIEEISWFTKLIQNIPGRLSTWLRDKGVSELSPVLGLKEYVLGLILGVENGFAHSTYIYDEFIKAASIELDSLEKTHGILFVVKFKHWIFRCQLLICALILSFYGLHRYCHDLIGISTGKTGGEYLLPRLYEIWTYHACVLGIVIEQVVAMTNQAEHCIEKIEARMTQVEGRCISLLRGPHKIYDFGSSYSDNLESDLSWLRSSIVYRIQRAHIPTDDISISLDDTYSYPPNSDPAQSYAMQLCILSDLGTVLLGEFSVKHLEDIAAVRCICQKSAIFSLRLCEYTLSLMYNSEDALFYFTRGLFLQHSNAKISKTTLCNAIDPDPAVGCVIHSTLQKNMEIFADAGFGTATVNVDDVTVKERYSAIMDVDNCIYLVISSIYKKYLPTNATAMTEVSMAKSQIFSLMLIPQLIDSLNLCVCSSLEGYTPRMDGTLSLKSPTAGLCTLMELLRAICTEVISDKKDDYFWSIMGCIGNFMRCTRTLEFRGSNVEEPDNLYSKTLCPSSLQVLEYCGGLMNILCSVIHGLSDMKVQITRNIERTKTKMLLSQIRGVNYSSPVVIPNASTDKGDYAIGFWMKIPTDYYENMHKYQSTSTMFRADNPAESIEVTTNSQLEGARHHVSLDGLRTHILSRVPEAGEVDMMSLFKDIPTSPCNPGVVLETLPDGSSSLIVSLTTSLHKNGVKVSKPVRVVKLRSRPLQADTWLDICIQFSNLPRSGEKNEAYGSSIVQLFVDGNMHASATDSFGRLSLHQNIIFGNIPVSLIKPSDESCLLVGGVRWASHTAHEQGSDVDGKGPADARPLDNSYPHSFSVIPLEDFKLSGQASMATVPSKDVKIPYLPVALLHDVLQDMTTSAECCMSITMKLLLSSAKGALNALNAPCVSTNCDDNLVYMCSFVRLLPSVGQWAVGLLGTGAGNSAIHEAAFEILKAYISILHEVKTLLGRNILPVTASAELQSSADAAISALQQHFMYLIAAVGVLVGCENFEGFSSVEGAEGRDIDSAVIQRHRRWLRRLQSNRTMSPVLVSPADISALSGALSDINIVQQNENVIVTSISALCAYTIDAGLLSINALSEAVKQASVVTTVPLHFILIGLFSGGGWPVSLRVNSMVDVHPRALFLNLDPKALEQSVFPSSAVVHSMSSGVGGRPSGVWMHRCTGGFLRCPISTELTSGDDVVKCSTLPPMHSVIIPRSSRAMFLGTEMIPSKDTHPPLALDFVADIMQMKPLGGSDDLQDLLNRLANKETSHISDCTGDETLNDDPALALTVFMAHIRSILVQLTSAEALRDDKRIQHLNLLRTVLERDLASIISIAAMDPVKCVVDAFKLASRINGSVSGQLDVLSNLLREGDVTFLEKISLRIWRHFQVIASTTRKGSSTEPIPSPVALAGDVQISGNRIRALSHFPSVRVLPVQLERMTGRWFYECTLLSDGLMQIGWADRAFRCDPVCGQGVGDHLHSWAVDGLRTKKWNVSCDTYGVRWKTEDVIGVLVDMDLLEMKFFVNGTDLGPAFENFSSNGLYPAVSLNVRQCMRVNYGQEMFLYPPTEVDGLPYRPVLEAFNMSKESERAKPSALSTVNAPPKTTLSNGTTGGVSEVKTDRSVSATRTSEQRVLPAESSTTASETMTRSVFVIDELGSATNDASAPNRDEISDATSPAPGTVLQRTVTVDTGDGADEASQSERRRGTGDNGSNTEDEYNGWQGSDSNALLESRTRNTTQQHSTSVTDSNDDVHVAGGSSVGRGTAGVDALFTGHQTSSSTPELEARRQLLIENLIGMGFPVDWALRAAENCDASLSESTAIAWIIERMELEQAKLEELEGGDSRVADEEDFDDIDDIGLDQNNRGFAFGTSGMGEAKESSAEDVVGRQRPSALAGQTIRMTSQSSGSQYPRGVSKQNSLKGNVNGDGNNSSQDAGIWNNEMQQYSTILAGHQSARRRFDMDKQAVLCQISELDFCDLFPIVLSCQFSLCVFYARAVFVRTMRLIVQSFDGLHFFSKRRTGQNDGCTTSPDCTLMNILLRCNSLNSFDEVVNLLGLCFKQGQGATSQPEKLFPSLLQGTLSGDPIDVSPLFAPFTSENTLNFTRSLSRLEMNVFGTYRSNIPYPRSVCSIAIEESYLQSTDTVVVFLKIISMLSSQSNVSFATKNFSADLATCKNLLSAVVDKAITTFEAAADDCYKKRDWISCGIERLGTEADFPHDRLREEFQKPNVLWAFLALRTILQSIKRNHTDHVDTLGIPSDDSLLSLEDILSTDSFTRLLKVVSITTTNTSMSYCVYGVCAEVLNSVNKRVDYLERLLLKSSEEDGTSDKGRNLLVKLTEFGQKELTFAAHYYAAVSTNLPFNGSSGGTTASIEYKLLRSLANRIMTESPHYRMHSRYARLLSEFLLEILTLRRSLTGSSPFTRSVHMDIVEDWKLPKGSSIVQTPSFSSRPIEKGENSTFFSDSNADEETVKSKDKSTSISLFVTQISANSITVAWSGVPEDDDWNVAVAKAAASSGRIAASVGGIIASITGPSPAQSSHTSYSLYVTPISGAQQSLPASRRSRPSLSLPFVSSSGTHKIDLLDPDTLYRISLTCDDDNFTPGGDSKQTDSCRSGLLSFSAIGKQQDAIGNGLESILKHGTMAPGCDSHDENDNDDGSLDIFPTHEEAGVMVSTLAEALFILDSSAASCPAHLQVANHGLTVRNTASKKWSTIRSTVRLSSGVHRWEVIIDRCISKNIFIGVVGPEARSDNYVGCDKYGWAFLANRAIWHNKGKMKAYGELFRTGDMVTVTLDIDQGTLAFAINGKDLGIAVDGLVGPLYPAFSLYNEDDQLSLSPPRQPSVESDAFSGSRWGTSSAERVMLRIEAVQSMLRHVVLSRQETSPNNNEYLVVGLNNPQLVTELCRRWTLWRSDVGLRSFRVDGDVLSVIVSSSSCLAFSDNRYCPGDVIQWENSQLTVVGVGRHRLWMQKTGNGDIVGFSRDTIQQLNSKNALRIVRKSNLYKATMKLSQTDLKSMSLTQVHELQVQDVNGKNIILSGESLEEDDVMRRALLAEGITWTREDDLTLVEWLDIRGRVVGSHPLNLKLHDVISPEAAVNTVIKMHRGGRINGVAASRFIEKFGGLAKRHSTLSIQLRSLFLIHLNDTLSPLLPLVFETGDSHGSFCANECDVMAPLSVLISNHRELILAEVKVAFGFRLGWSTAAAYGTQSVLTRSSSSSAGKSDSSKPTESSSSMPRVVYSVAPCELPLLPQKPVAREAMRTSASASHIDKDGSRKHHCGQSPEEYSSCFVHWSSISSAAAIVPAVDIVISESKLLVSTIFKLARSKSKDSIYGDDCRWKLLAAYQSSYIGQMMQNFECSEQYYTQLHPPLTSNGAEVSRRSGEGTWDTIIRSVHRGGMFWEDYIPPKARSIPIRIRSKQPRAPLDDYSSRVLRLLCLNDIHDAFESSSRISMSSSSAATSDWLMLQAFVADAMAEVQALLQSKSLNSLSREDSTSSVSIDVLSDILCGRKSDNKEAGLLNMLLQIMHGTGVVLGVALRSGLTVTTEMPNYFWSVLSNNISNRGTYTLDTDNEMIANVRESLARAMRHGITSCVPEAFLDILGEEELRTLLTQGGTLNVEHLRENAVCKAPLTRTSKRIEMFWAAMGDLPKILTMRLLQAVWSTASTESDTDDIPEEMFHWKGTNHTLRPLTLADWAEFPGHSTSDLIDKDSSRCDFQSIFINTELQTIYIPNYSTIAIMQGNLRSCIESL